MSVMKNQSKNAKSQSEHAKIASENPKTQFENAKTQKTAQVLAQVFLDRPSKKSPALISHATFKAGSFLNTGRRKN